MALTAYVLVTTTAKEVQSTLDRLRSSNNVRSADAVTGPYDIIATVQAENMDALGGLVTKEIHNIEGVERTLTCIVLDL